MIEDPPSNYLSALITPLAWQGTSITFSFLDAIPSYYDYSQSGDDFIRLSFTTFNATQRAAIADILNTIRELINVPIVEAVGSIGDITFGNYKFSPSKSRLGIFGEVPALASLSSPTSRRGDVWINSETALFIAEEKRYVDLWAFNKNPVLGSDAYNTLLHEVLHALGLKHVFDGGPDSAFQILENPSGYSWRTPYADVVDQLRTVMSRDHTGANAFLPEPMAVSPMLWDVAALQQMYGANMSTRQGDNDIYTFSSSRADVRSIWDAGGAHDTISAANQNRSAIIDLRPGAFSAIGPQGNSFFNIAIAFNPSGVTNNYIEDAIGSSKADLITGNAAQNYLSGLAGNDTLDGGTSQSAGKLVGGTRTPAGLGDSAVDTLEGGAGNDTYILRLNGGQDVLRDHGKNTLNFVNLNGDGPVLPSSMMLFASNAGDGKWKNRDGSVEAIKEGGDLVVKVTTSESEYKYEFRIPDFASGDFNISLVGTPGPPVPQPTVIYGDRRPEEVGGQYTGRKDVYGNLVVTEALADNRADLLFDLNFNSSQVASSNDKIVSAGGNDTIFAASGNDWIQSGTGADLIVSGDGDDLIETGSGEKLNLLGNWDSSYGDIVNAGDGDDQIYGDGTIALIDAIVQGDVQNGASPQASSERGDYLSGGAGNNLIIGTNARDVLSGDKGNDTLVSGAGDDWILGDAGFASNTLNWFVTSELLAYDFTGTEIDDVDVQTGLTNAFVRNTFYHGTAGNFSGIGGDDVIYAGAGKDNVAASGGDDFVDGGTGDDTIQAGDGFDTILAGDGADWVLGDSLGGDLAKQGGDVIDGGAGSDFLFGLGGNDQMFGGIGNDRIEGGRDNDYLQGDTGDDTLVGGSGSDTLYGGSGTDVLRGGLGKDTYIFTRGDGVETIFDPDDATGGSTDPNDANSPNPDKSILILRGVNRSDIKFAKGSLLIDLGPSDVNDPNSAHDQIHLEGFDSASPDVTQMLAYIQFDDGSRMTYADILAQGFDIEGTVGNDNDIPDSESIILPAVTGTGANDRIRGLTGDDVLVGLGGNDTYLFSLGDGEDTIIDAEGATQLQFGAGITAGDLVTTLTTQYDPNLGQSVNYLKITYGEGDSVSIREGLLQGQTTYKLASGTVLTQEEILSSITAPLYLQGSAGDDVLVGGGGNDYVAGSEGNNLLVGGAGNDTLNAGSGDDVLVGGAGKDQLIGGAGADTYVGGADNDVLYGGASGDTYVFSTGDGIDLIADSGGANVISFGEGIEAGDIHAQLISASDGQVYLELDYSDSDSVLLRQSFSTASTASYSFTFADGSTKTQAELMSTAITAPIFFHGGFEALHLVGSSFDDILEGGSNDDYLEAGSGDALLSGGGGSDTLIGGAGADTLSGGAGDDVIVGGSGVMVLDGGTGDDTVTLGDDDNTYTFARGMGKDQVINGAGSGNVNTFQLEGDLTIGDLYVDQVGEDLYLHVRNAREGVLIKGYYDAGQNLDASTWQVKATDGGLTSFATLIANQAQESPLASVTAAWQAFQAKAWNYYRGALSAAGFHSAGNGTYVYDSTAGSGTFTTHDHVVVSLGSVTTQVAEAGVETTRDTGVFSATSSSNTTTTQQVTYGSHGGLMSVGSSYAGTRNGGGASPTFVSIDDMWRSAGGISLGPVGSNTTTPVYIYNVLVGFLISAANPTTAELAAPRTTTFTHVENSYGYVLNPLEIHGEAGDKTITISASSDPTRWAGFNYVDSGEGNNLVQVVDGDDIYVPRGTYNFVDATQYNAIGNFLYGSGDNDTLIGGNYDDVLAVDNGDKLLMGGGGNNTYYLFQTAGHDTILNEGTVPPGQTRESVVVMPDGVELEDLTFSWGSGTYTGSAGSDGLRMESKRFNAESVYRTLTLAWDVDSSVTIVLPHADQNSGVGGIDFLQLSDGTRVPFGDLLALAGTPPADPRDAANTLTAGSGNAVLDGGAGADSLTGGTGNDTLIGGSGRDTLIGGSGNNVLIGSEAREVEQHPYSGLPNVMGATYYDAAGNVYRTGTGNDTIWATSGSDTFEFNLTTGQYTVTDLHHNWWWLNYGGEAGVTTHFGEPFPVGASDDGRDTIKFGAGIGVGDVSITIEPPADWWASSSLVFHVGTNGEEVRFTDWRGWDNEQLSQVEFDDGTVWNRDDIRVGAEGSFDFEVGMGARTITNLAALESVRMDYSLWPAGVTVLRSGDDLILADGSLGDSLQIKGWFADPVNRPLATIDFENANTTWDDASIGLLAGPSSEDIVGTTGNDVLTGTSARDTLRGLAGNDQLAGAAGADLMIGGAGDDTYDADTQDVIVEGTNGGTDTVILAGLESGTYHLAENVENLVVNGRIFNWGAPALIIAGSSDANQISLQGAVGYIDVYGNGGNDIISVLSADPQGYYGQYHLYGGIGDDYYYVNVGASAYSYNNLSYIIENAGEGNDTLEINAPTGYIYNLRDNSMILAEIETIKLVGSASGVYATESANIIYGNTVLANTIYSYGGNDLIYGGNAGNNLSGGEGDDTLIGGDGDDFLSGDGGNDSMVGGLGDDFYNLDSLDDVIVEFAGEGTDTVTTNFSYALAEGGPIENLNVSWDGVSSTALMGTGNSAANVMSGYEASLYGLGGDDSFHVWGNNTLAGGAGSDSYIFDNGSILGVTTIVNDDADTGSTDVIRMDASNLPEDFAISHVGDDMILTNMATNGRIVISGWYASADNQIDQVEFADNTVWTAAYLEANAVAAPPLRFINIEQAFQGKTVVTPVDENGNQFDVIRFASGDLPADIAIHRVGNDMVLSHQTAHGRVVITDWYVSAGNQFDSIKFADGTTWTPTYLEAHATDGPPAMFGTSDADTLIGSEDADALYGQEGDDIISGGDGADTLYGQEGDDSISGGDGADTLYGQAGDDTISGGGGADVMVGGEGSDTYYIDNFETSINEAADEGDDVVVVSVSYAMEANLEQATLAADGLTVIGNELANIFNSYGVVANTLAGGRGDDVYYAHLSDVIIETAIGGVDTVYLSDIEQNTYTLAENVENLVATGAGQEGGVDATEIHGNEAGNQITFQAFSGLVTIHGYGGNDTLISASVVNGDFHGGQGDDTYFVKAGGNWFYDYELNTLVFRNKERIHESVGEGSDTVEISGSGAFAFDDVDAEVETIRMVDALSEVTATNSANIIFGNEATGNTMYGLAGADTLIGGTHDDVLDGGAGIDSLVGGLGDDLYVLDTADDVVIENADEGSDTIRTTFSYTLTENGSIENLEVLGDGEGAAPSGTGNSSDNKLSGSDAALYGLAGNDTLSSLGGSSVLAGGEGNDIYEFDFLALQGKTTIIENDATSGNTDVIRLSGSVVPGDIAINHYGNDLILTHLTLHGRIVIADWYLSSDRQVERVEFADETVWTATDMESNAVSGPPPLFGTSFADALTGTADAEAIHGLEGDDTISGVSGADILAGNIGDDTYHVDDAAAVIVEQQDEGNDTAVVSVSYSVGSNVENIVVLGDEIAVTGNEQGNVFHSSGILGNTLAGGDGDDVYNVSLTDVVVEAAAAGTDTVNLSGWSGGTYQLAANVENLVVIGDASGSSGSILEGNSRDNLISLEGVAGVANVSGGDGNDSLHGGDGENTLNGGAGNDVLYGGVGPNTLIGGLGDDLYILNDSSDVIVEESDEGTDTIQASFSYTLDEGDAVENLSIQGDGQGSSLVGTGNSADNGLEGSNATLYGLGGEDTLRSVGGVNTFAGGDGDDTYLFDFGALQGRTTIVENDSTTGNHDVIRFDTGNVPSDIDIHHYGDDLILTHRDSNSSIVIAGWYVSTDNQVESVEFADNTVWTASYLEAHAIVGPPPRFGTSGADFLIGTENAETIYGEDGDDGITSGTGGADLLIGGVGNDTYYIESADATALEQADEGDDTVVASFSYTASENIETIMAVGAGITVTGNAQNNRLYSTGATGNTVTLAGGYGSDSYSVRSFDTVVEDENDGEVDGISLQEISGGAYQLADHVENLSVTGVYGTVTLDGNDENNNIYLYSTGGSYSVSGGAGDDTFFAMPGINFGSYDYYGGLGDDYFYVGLSLFPYYSSYGLEQIHESAGEGNDTVEISTASYFFNDQSAEIETIKLTGVATSVTATNTNNTIYGNALLSGILDGVGGDDVIYGLHAGSLLRGGDGNDTLIGSGYLYGGADNDTFVVGDDGTANIVEYANEGTDMVRSSINWVLDSNIENLVLTNAFASYGTGNSLDNLIHGSTGDNVLEGADGVDILEGDAGADALSDASYGDAGYFNGGSGNDSMTGGAGSEIFIGGLGDDLIDTGEGYDIVVFNKGDGHDTVNASADGNNTLSLGGGLLYSDLSFTKTGDDLVLGTGNGESVTLTDWYASSANHSVLNLQVAAEAMASFDPLSSDPLFNKKVQTFDFQGLVDEFDTALAGNPSLSGWALTNALAAFQISGTDTGAIGGDLAYQYGVNGSNAGIGADKARDVMTDSAFGQSAQTLSSLSSLQEGLVRLG